MGTLLGKIGDDRIKNRLLSKAQVQMQTIERLNSRPRVLHLVTSFEAGGTERQFVELLKLLDRERFDVRLAAIRKEGAFYDEIASEFSVIPEFRLTSFYDRNALRQLFRLRRLIKSERIEIIHAHGFYDSLFGAVAGRLSGITVIASQRHLKLSDRPVHDWGTRIIHRLAHRIIVNSNAIRDSIVAKGVPDEKIVVIRNGLGESLNSPALGAGLMARQPFDTNEGCNHQSQNAICRELGLHTHSKIVGMVARLVTVKGHQYFIEAAAKVAREDERVHFVLVGDGPLKDKIETQAKQCGIRERIHFLGDRKDAQQLVSSFDIAVLTSLSEGLPNTVMEAMSQGVPVVATAVGGTLELITDKETGFLVPAADAEALAAQILYLLHNEKNSKAVAEKGREFIRTQFSMSKMVQSVEGLYEQLLAQ